jgi:hypothetical protein
MTPNTTGWANLSQMDTQFQNISGSNAGMPAAAGAVAAF